MDQTQVFCIEGFSHRYVGAISDGRLEQLHVSAMVQPPQVGQIYLGRIQKQIPNQNAYFVSIGWDLPGYLQGADIAIREDGRPRLVGDTILVQIKHEAHGTKGPKVTDKLSLQGQHLVLLAGESKVHVSQKIKDRAWIKEAQAHFKGRGLILRTEATQVPFEMLEREYQALYAQVASWSWGKEELLYQAKPRLLHEQTPDWQLLHQRLLAVPGAVAVEGTRNPFKALALDDKIRELLARTHRTADGCELVIDQLEALTAIDVNARAYKGRGFGGPQAIAEMNRSVVADVLRLIALRDISGMILVDFVNMAPEGQKDILETFKASVDTIDVKGFTRLGILELTRPRRGLGLQAHLSTDTVVRGVRESSVTYLIDQMLFEIKEDIWAAEAWLIEASEDVAQALKRLKQRIIDYFPDYQPEIYVKQVARCVNFLSVQHYHAPKDSGNSGLNVQIKNIDVTRLI